MITDREAQIASLQAMYDNNIGQHRLIVRQFDFLEAAPKSQHFLFAEHQAERQLLNALRKNQVPATQALDILAEVLKWP